MKIAMLQRDTAGVIHIEMPVQGRHNYRQWTPMCEPNTDWYYTDAGFCRDESAPTCLWCVAEARLR